MLTTPSGTTNMPKKVTIQAMDRADRREALHRASLLGRPHMDRLPALNTRQSDGHTLMSACRGSGVAQHRVSPGCEARWSLQAMTIVDKQPQNHRCRRNSPLALRIRSPHHPTWLDTLQRAAQNMNARTAKAGHSLWLHLERLRLSWLRHE
jgi:hypothetical protein